MPGTGALRTRAPWPAQACSASASSSSSARVGRLSARSPGRSAIIAEVAPSRVSTPSVGMPETSLSSSAASSAAAQAGPLPNATALAASSAADLVRPRLRACPSAVACLLGQASQRAREARVRRELGPDRERGDDVAAEGLRVGDGPLVRHRDERPGAGARPDRRARGRGHRRVRRGRSRIDRLDEVAELARRRDREEGVTGPPREGAARDQVAELSRRGDGEEHVAGRHAKAPRASRPLGTASTSGPSRPSSDASQRATQT